MVGVVVEVVIGWGRGWGIQEPTGGDVGCEKKKGAGRGRKKKRKEKKRKEKQNQNKKKNKNKNKPNKSKSSKGAQPKNKKQNQKTKNTATKALRVIFLGLFHNLSPFFCLCLFFSESYSFKLFSSVSLLL